MLMHRYDWCHQNGYTVFLAGDFNSHMGELGTYGIPNSCHMMNTNGALLTDFLSRTTLRNLHSNPNTTGFWTFENASLNQRSVIDMIFYEAQVQVRSGYIDDQQYNMQISSDHNFVWGEFEIESLRAEPIPMHGSWKRFISAGVKQQFINHIEANIEALPSMLDNPYFTLVNTIRDTAQMYYGRPVRRSGRRREPRAMHLARRELRDIKSEFK